MMFSFYFYPYFIKTEFSAFHTLKLAVVVLHYDLVQSLSCKCFRYKMNVIQWKKAAPRAVVAMFILLFMVYFLIPRRSYKHKFVPRYKVRHPVSYYLKQIETNNTLYNMALDQEFLHPDSKAALKRYFRPKSRPAENLGHVPRPELQDFDINTDVMVYLQIQKIGDTTFNHLLMNSLDKGFDCNCKDNVVRNPCHCKNKNGHIWLFSWFTVGWPCELHADWTMLHDCVDKSLNSIEGKRSRR